MKLEQVAVNNTSNFAGETFEGAIDVTKLSSILSLLIRNYNSPELATLREWVSNAHDSHKEAGVKRPIKVTLPSKFSSTLTVEDFGTGMSYDDVRTVYVNFLNSTKNESNSGIGGFGIGGKSALALADQYTMTAVKDGLKNVFIFERSDNGGLAVKPIVRDRPTDEHSGVKVSVAVSSSWNFNKQQIDAVLEGWAADEIELVNGDFTSFHQDALEFKHGFVKNEVFDSSTEQPYRSGWGYQRSKARVFVGPVSYPLPDKVSQALTHDDKFRKFNSATGERFAIKVKIGDVTFPSSREVIEPTDSNIAVILAQFKKLYAEVEAHVNKRVANFATVEEAYNFTNSQFAKAADMKVIYKGRELSNVTYSGVRSFYINRFNDQDIKISANTALTFKSAEVAVVILLDEADTDLTADTYRKYIRGALKEYYFDPDEQKKRQGRYFGSINVLLTTEEDELQHITSKVLKFSELRKKPVTKTASVKLTEAEVVTRAGREQGSVVRNGRRNALNFKSFVEKVGDSPIIYLNDDDATEGAELIGKLFDVESRIFIVQRKTSVAVIKKAYPKAVTFNEFFESRTPEELAQAKKTLKKISKIVKLLSINSNDVAVLAQLKQGKLLNEKLTGLLDDAALAVASPALRLFTQYRYRAKESYTYGALSHLVNVKELKASKTGNKTGPFALADFSYYTDRNELAAYLNWSADRHFAAHA